MLKFFLAKFESFMTLQFVDLHQDLEQSNARKIAALHVHLAGPVQIWFYSLPSTDKQSWDTLLENFREQYVPTNTAYDLALMVESAAFNKLQLGATQSLEDFHSVIRQTTWKA